MGINLFFCGDWGPKLKGPLLGSKSQLFEILKNPGYTSLEIQCKNTPVSTIISQNIVSRAFQVPLEKHQTSLKLSTSSNIWYTKTAETVPTFESEGKKCYNTPFCSFCTLLSRWAIFLEDNARLILNNQPDINHVPCLQSQDLKFTARARMTSLSSYNTHSVLFVLFHFSPNLAL